MTRKTKSAASESVAPTQEEISARVQALEAVDRDWLKLQLVLEHERAPDDGSAPAASDVARLAVEFIGGSGPAIPEKRVAELRQVRLVRAALREAIAISQHEWIAAGNSRAVREFGRLEHELAALTRQRAEAALTLQAINRRWIAMARHIRRGAPSFPLPCEIPESPNVLLGPGFVTHGSTADFIRRVVAEGLLTQGEVDRLLGDKEGKVK